MPARALKKREPSTPITMTVSGRSGRAIAKNNDEKTGRKKKPSWRGTGNVSTLNVKFRPYADAAHFVSALSLRTSREWHAYSRTQRCAAIRRAAQPASRVPRHWLVGHARLAGHRLGAPALQPRPSRRGERVHSERASLACASQAHVHLCMALHNRLRGNCDRRTPPQFSHCCGPVPASRPAAGRPVRAQRKPR